jgi:hypothetical protein
MRAGLERPGRRALLIVDALAVPVLADVRRQKAKFDRDQAKTLGRQVAFQKARFEEAREEPPGTTPPPNPDSIA